MNQIGETEETYHVEIHSLIQSVRSLRHDFADHIQVLNGLLKLGKQQEALDYSNLMREEAQVSHLSAAKQYESSGFICFIPNKIS